MVPNLSSDRHAAYLLLVVYLAGNRPREFLRLKQNRVSPLARRFQLNLGSSHLKTLWNGHCLYNWVNATSEARSPEATINYYLPNITNCMPYTPLCVTGYHQFIFNRPLKFFFDTEPSFISLCRYKKSCKNAFSCFSNSNVRLEFSIKIFLKFYLLFLRW